MARIAVSLLEELQLVSQALQCAYASAHDIAVGCGGCARKLFSLPDHQNILMEQTRQTICPSAPSTFDWARTFGRDCGQDPMTGLDVTFTTQWQR